MRPRFFAMLVNGVTAGLSIFNVGFSATQLMWLADWFGSTVRWLVRRLELVIATSARLNACKMLHRTYGKCVLAIILSQVTRASVGSRAGILRGGMFPNVRLIIVAMLASMASICCCLGVFAAFRVNHEPFTRSQAATRRCNCVFATEHGAGRRQWRRMRRSRHMAIALSADTCRLRHANNACSRKSHPTADILAPDAAGTDGRGASPTAGTERQPSRVNGEGRGARRIGSSQNCPG